MMGLWWAFLIGWWIGAITELLSHEGNPLAARMGLILIGLTLLTVVASLIRWAWKLWTL